MVPHTRQPPRELFTTIIWLNLPTWTRYRTPWTFASRRYGRLNSLRTVFTFLCWFAVVGMFARSASVANAVVPRGRRAAAAAAAAAAAGDYDSDGGGGGAGAAVSRFYVSGMVYQVSLMLCVVWSIK